MIEFHRWQGAWWLEKIGICVTLPEQRVAEQDSFLEGANAYARRQAFVRCSLLSRCAQAWKDVPTWVGDS